MEQFLTRFLLRETMHQLQSLQGSLECAVDTMEEQAGGERYWVLAGCAVPSHHHGVTECWDSGCFWEGSVGAALCDPSVQLALGRTDPNSSFAFYSFRKDIKISETLVGLRSGRRCGRRGQKNICLSPTDPYSGMLTTGTVAQPSWSRVSG